MGVACCACLKCRQTAHINRTYRYSSVVEQRIRKSPVRFGLLAVFHQSGYSTYWQSPAKNFFSEIIRPKAVSSSSRKCWRIPRSVRSPKGTGGFIMGYTGRHRMFVVGTAKGYSGSGIARVRSVQGVTGAGG